MSTERPIYGNNTTTIPKTLAAFRNHPSTLPSQLGYQKPDAETVKALMEIMGWTQNQVAIMTGVNFTKEKGSSTVRRWKTLSKDHKQIPYSAWRLMLLVAGIVDIHSDKEAMYHKDQVASE